MKIILFLFLGILVFTEIQSQTKAWMLGPFERPENATPIISPNEINVFSDPMPYQ